MKNYNDVESISVKTKGTPFGTVKKAGTLVYVEDTSVYYYITADATGIQSLLNTSHSDMNGITGS